LCPLGGGLRWCGAALLGMGLLTTSTQAQTLRLGPMDIYIQGMVEVAYDSNVDDAYPEEVKEGLDEGDFYIRPGLRINTQKMPLFRRTLIDFEGRVSYEDYFSRSDLDTELYNVNLEINTLLPRIDLGVMVSTEYTVDSSEDQYIPGGVTRDPKQVNAANAYADWHHQKFRIETHADYSTERHDYDAYVFADQDESIIFAGVYLDLFTWGSLFYSWEQTLTTYTQTDEEVDGVVKKFGFDGAIPLSWLAHPQITYSLGIESNEDSSDEDKDATWEPSHSIRAEDKLQMSKTLSLSGYVQYENKIYDDDIGFTYTLELLQLLGPRARHSLIFSQEPRATFGSTQETESTSFTYLFKISDLFIYNLSAYASAMYELETPLEVEDAETEKTTTLLCGLNHTRQISRQLSRVIAYDFSLEDSNFHDDGSKEKHLVTYSIVYNF